LSACVDPVDIVRFAQCTYSGESSTNKQHTLSRLPGGQVQTHIAYSPLACRGSLAGCAPASIWDANTLLRPATFMFLESVIKVALHPCQQAAAFLDCTRTPDFVPDLAALLRVLRPYKFFPALTTTVFQLLQSTSTSSRRLVPTWDPAQDVERSPVVLGLRTTCIRRAASSAGLLVTSFGGLHHFNGLSTHPLPDHSSSG
jgi:hypothetical protein